MKIIKQGKSKEELEVILKNEKQFKCRTCECIFEADKTEYESEDDYIYTMYYCKCPNCGNIAYKDTGRRYK